MDDCNDYLKEAYMMLKVLGLDLDRTYPAEETDLTEESADRTEGGAIKPALVSDDAETKVGEFVRKNMENLFASGYIEAYIAANTTASPYETIESLREEIRRKDKQISGFVRRDATISKYKAENQEMANEITSLQETIKSQEELIHQLKDQPNVVKDRSL